LAYVVAVRFLFPKPLQAHSDWIISSGIFSSKAKIATHTDHYQPWHHPGRTTPVILCRWRAALAGRWLRPPALVSPVVTWWMTPIRSRENPFHYAQERGQFSPCSKRLQAPAPAKGVSKRGRSDL